MGSVVLYSYFIIYAIFIAFPSCNVEHFASNRYFPYSLFCLINHYSFGILVFCNHFANYLSSIANYSFCIMFSLAYFLIKFLSCSNVINSRCSTSSFLAFCFHWHFLQLIDHFYFLYSFISMLVSLFFVCFFTVSGFFRHHVFFICIIYLLMFWMHESL